MKDLSTVYFSIIFLFVYSSAFSQQPPNWIPLQSFELGSKEALRAAAMPNSFKAYQLAGLESLAQQFQTAPLRFSAEARYSAVEISLPLPDGTSERYKIFNSPVMEPALAASYTQLETFTGESIRNPHKKAKITMSPQGLFAMIIGDAEGTIFIRPFSFLDQTYYSFYAKHLTESGADFNCSVEDDWTEVTAALENDLPSSRSNDCQLRQYRLALACTGEYAQFYSDGNDMNGDTVADVLATMVIMMNQLNGIFEQEVGVTMIIIDQNRDLIFTNPNTDPYTNESPSDMLSENVITCTNIIGNANFDIGHVFGQGGGGFAFRNSPLYG